MKSETSRVFTIHFFALLLFISFSVAGQGKSQSGDEQRQAVYSLITRLLPDYAGQFKITIIPQEKGKDVFEIESSDGKVVLRGSNGVSVASALNYYLKNFGHCDVSWNGSNLKLPARLPVVPQKIKKNTPYQYRYYLNYCTFNYSMSWWDWERWEKEIDWMALNGINMPLAITGQNSVWKRVYNSMGFTDRDLEGFFSGPAYFNWFWMGNLDGWGGPLPQSFMEKHEVLQKKILDRQRELGMTPILPAFTGHVPPAFKEKYPKANLKKTHWSTFPDVYILDPDDPMFTEIGIRFLKEEIKTYGTDHLYTSDTFNENAPPTNDSTFLSAVSKKVYQSMAAADPEATWIMQGWLFHFHAKFWQPQQIKALLNAVPDDKMIILDLWSENHPVWNRTEAYYGKPWIWCMLHNFGGNISMYGRMDEVASGPAAALKSPESGKMAGIGLTPEAIEQNPVMYSLMLENVWNDTPIDIDTWLKDYARRRYGKQNADAWQAWKILKSTVYTGGIMNGGPESIITGRPTFAPNTGGTRPHKNYRPKDLLPAWSHLIKASNDLQISEGFRYDLIDVTRQVLANYADTIQILFASAYKEGNDIAYQERKNEFLQIIEDMDTLLGTQKGFLLGEWLNSAKKLGDNAAEKALYEKNARNLITLWGDRDARLHEYSCRQWNGMLKGFYKARWDQFFDYIDSCRDNKKEPDLKMFEERMKDWEWKWVNGNEAYPDKPQGNPVSAAQRVYRKYNAKMSGLYKP